MSEKPQDLDEWSTLNHLASKLRKSRSANDVPTVVITGANSGIGLIAAKLFMIINPLTRLVIAARTMDKAKFARDEVLKYLPNDDVYQKNVIPLECDHCSLQSVKKFVVKLQKSLTADDSPLRVGQNGIDVLCLNAAVLLNSDSKAVFTEDGLETTFQVNHLSPFLIARLTEGMLNPGARVIFSTSGLHVGRNLSFSGIIDPATGNVRRGFEMINGSEFHFKHSYSLSKLCNVATCAYLNRRLQHKERRMLANCFSPGLMTKSGLFRNQENAAHPMPNGHNDSLFCKEKTVVWGAGSLVFMALADETGICGGHYWRDESMAGSAAEYGKEFCSVPISEDTLEQRNQETLWNLSNQLVGIPVENT